MKSDLIDLSLHQVAETPRAILVESLDFTSPKVWLPKSQIEIERTDRGDYVTVTLPEWLAIEKKLV
jgi:hypothetical protein